MLENEKKNSPKFIKENDEDEEY